MATKLNKPEIIAVASGKGGTGKTLITACLGWLLTIVGKRGLLIDGDPGTDGLSLFLLGPEGWKQLDALDPANTFAGSIRGVKEGGVVSFEPAEIERKAKIEGYGTTLPITIGEERVHDHGIKYRALVTAKTIYGDYAEEDVPHPVPDLGRTAFRHAIQDMFATLRGEKLPFDFVLVDTRGGFAAETTDICALADSFIVVTEADITSFYQDRNLVRHINIAAQEMDATPLLRAFIVNKATETVSEGGELNLNQMEQSFRLELENEFPVRYSDTYAIPLDVEALKAYKTHRIPFLDVPGSHFSYAALTAFASILRIVTERWADEQVAIWNEVAELVDNSIRERRMTLDRQEETRTQQDAMLVELQKENTELRQQTANWKRDNDQLRSSIDEMKGRYERELTRAQFILEKTSGKSNEAVPADREPGTTQSMSHRFTASKSKRMVLAALGLVTVSAIAGIWSFYALRETTAAKLERLYSGTGAPTIKATLLRELYEGGTINFAQVDLSFVDISGLNLEGASFRGARMISAMLRATDLSNADLGDALLDSANLNGASLTEANLNGASLKRANLNRANLKEANLNGANLNGAKLDNASLSGASLIEASLIEASLFEASLFEASLNGANLIRANLNGANLNGGKFEWGKFEWIDS